MRPVRVDAGGAEQLPGAGPERDPVSIAPAGPGNFAASGHGLAVPFVAGAAALVRSYRPA